jgi:hypothetical protein
VVYRPELKAPAQPVRMAAQKVDERHPVIQHTPIAPVRTDRPSTVVRSGATPGATQRRPTVEAPKASPWSTGAKPTTSPQSQPGSRNLQPAPTPAAPRSTSRSSDMKPAAPSQSQPTGRTYQPATPVLPTVTAPRAPENWKQGASAAPGYRSDAGLPALNNARMAGEVPSTIAQTPAQNPHVYAPKSARQAAEIRSLPQSDQRQSATPASSGKGGDSRSRKQ